MDFAGLASVTMALIGLAVLEGEVGFLGVVASSLGIPFWVGIGAYTILGFLAIFGWPGDKSLNQSREVLGGFLVRSYWEAGFLLVT